MKAWPRFLPEATTDAMAYALIIEAYAIVVQELAEGHASLAEAHQRALDYASARYAAAEIRAACQACAAAAENANVPFHCPEAFLPGRSEGVTEKPVRAAANGRGAGSAAARRRGRADAQPAPSVRTAA